ncbi:hypothetical protein AB0H73_23305 [Streptomyces olivoreticuli]
MDHRAVGFRQELDDWIAEQPSLSLRDPDAERSWPQYAELAAAEQETAVRLRPLAALLETYAQTGELHQPGYGWIRIGTETLHEGRFLTLHRDQVIQPDGVPSTCEHVTTADGARVVAVNDDGLIAVVDDFTDRPLAARITR